MFSSSNVLTLSVLLRFCFSESSFATNLAANSDGQARGGAGLASTMPSSDWCRARRARASESPSRPARHVWISWGNFTCMVARTFRAKSRGPATTLRAGTWAPAPRSIYPFPKKKIEKIKPIVLKYPEKELKHYLYNTPSCIMT